MYGWSSDYILRYGHAKSALLVFDRFSSLKTHFRPFPISRDYFLDKREINISCTYKLTNRAYTFISYTACHHIC